MSEQPLFGVIGDPHISHRVVDDIWLGVDELKAQVKLLNDIKDLKYVFIPGDLSHNVKPSEFKMAKQLLDKLNAKYFCCPGNHDYLKVGGWSEYCKVFGRVQYAVKIGGYNLLVLPSRGYTAFKNLDRRLPSIALQHNALRLHLNNLIPSKVEPFLFKHNVKCVFQGHYHGKVFDSLLSDGDYDTVHNGIRYITCGTSCVGIGRLSNPLIYDRLARAC